MDILFLAKIEYYCKFSFRYAEGLDSSNVHTEWIAFVTYYDEHPVWSSSPPGPTQVWARSTHSRQCSFGCQKLNIESRTVNIVLRY